MVTAHLHTNAHMLSYELIWKGFSHSWGDLHQIELVSGEELNVNHVTLSVIWACKYERLLCSML